MVIGYCDDTGLWLQGGAALESEGTPLALNRFSDYRTVQEQPVKLGSWANSCGLPLNPARLEGGSPAPVRLRFTGFSRLARGGSGGYDLYAMGHWRFSQLAVQDCAFSGGVVMLYAGAGSGAGPMGLTNNLWQRQGLYVLGEPTLWLYNNLFKDCPAVSFDVWGGSSLLRDNVFDSVVLEALFDPPPIHSHNAYINVRDFRGNPARLEPPQTNDVVLAGFNYVAGLLGPFYQPTNSPLLNVGSRSAAEAGLYHFTVLTHQTKAGLLGNGQVSIGYHYVALNAQGQPLDTDGDGMPDYLEDANGDGIFSSGDLSHWQDPNADADGDGLPDGWEWKYFGNLAQHGSDDYDHDGMSNWHEYLLRSDPNTIRFSISLPKRHVNSSPVPLTLTVLGAFLPAWRCWWIVPTPPVPSGRPTAPRSMCPWARRRAGGNSGSGCGGWPRTPNKLGGASWSISIGRRRRWCSPIRPPALCPNRSSSSRGILRRS